MAGHLLPWLLRCRSQAYAAALSGDSDAGGEDAFSPPQARRASALGDAAAAAPGPRPSGDGASAGVSAEGSAEAAAEGDEYASPPAAARRQRPPPARPPPDWNRYDERPAQAKGAYVFDNADATSTPVNTRRTSQPGVAPRAAASEAGPPPPGFPAGGREMWGCKRLGQGDAGLLTSMRPCWTSSLTACPSQLCCTPADLPPPEALSAADAKDAAPLSDLAGEYLARCAYSRTWQLREAALAALARQLEAGQLEAVAGGSAGGAPVRGLLAHSACMTAHGHHVCV